MRRPSTNRSIAYLLISTLVGSLFLIVLPAPRSSYASHENITVNIGDDVTNIYDPGDSIVITGTIDDVQDDEDVTIRVLDPSGSEEEEDDVTPDEDDGYFDFVFDIPSDADGGIWTFEVTYDGDKAYSYFMVEYDEDEIDVITVELDQSDGIYQAEDTVEIEGAIVDDDPEEEFVRIIVLDPSNGELVDNDEVELDDEDFTFEFDLDDAHGRYAVIVTYADQEGASVLEVEDEDEGSDDDEDLGEDAITEASDDDLSAEIDEDVYQQGGTVIIRGTIEDYNPDDDEELGITIMDPDDTEVEVDDDVDVDEDGNDGVFEFEYDIDDNADEGLYTIAITYGNDEVDLAFVVEEGSGGDSGGSDEMTVKLDKTTYLAGETMTVSGTVEEVADPDDGELLSIFLYRPGGQVILSAGSSKYITPSSSGSFSTTILIPSDLENDRGYRVKVSYLGETVEATFDITGVSSTPVDKITVETDRDEYSVGDTVEISGEVPDSMIVTGQQLLIRVDKPDGNPCRIDPITLPSSGSFTYDLVLGGVCDVGGEYDIEITYGDEEASTSFELIGPSVSSYNLNVEGDTYPIEYELSSGAINNMFVRPIENKLVITLDAENEGQLVVTLPREVIDAIEDGEDIDFVVTAEDEQGNINVLDFEETENKDDERTLVIDYEAGTGRIEIQGTQVVPEFGTIAAIVLAVAIVGIIFATAQYGKLSLFRQ